MACDHESQMTDASALCCIPPNLHAAVQSYLLAKIRAGSMDVGEILRDSACLSSCIPPGLLPRIKTYLMCQLSNAGGTPTPIPEPECDADAQTFITAAGITVQAQQDAICRLVAALKHTGTPSFWDSEIVIYPFVGGTGPQHSYNLKDPTTYQLTYHGAAVPTHNQFGMIGTGSGYANTHYIPRVGPPAMVDTTGRVYTYLYASDPTAGHYHWGAISDAGANRTQGGVGAASANIFGLYSSNVGNSGSSANGGYIVSTVNGVTRQVGFDGGAYVSPAYVHRTTSNSYMILLARNFNGVPPAVSPLDYSVSRICGFSIGSRGLSQSEWTAYHSIWQTFQTELGRQRP